MQYLHVAAVSDLWKTTSFNSHSVFSNSILNLLINCSMSSSHAYSPLMSVPPLTVEKLLSSLEDVKEKWSSFGFYLSVQSDMLMKIKRQYITSKNRLAAVLRYVLQLHPYASWRVVIRTLDAMKEHKVADEIRKCAEPISGICVGYSLLWLIQAKKQQQQIGHFKGPFGIISVSIV